MPRQSSIALNFLLLGLLLFPPTAQAETKILTAEGTYTMGDGETPTVAEARALHNAKRMAVEQAGTYLQSYTMTKDFQLTDDELQTIAGALLKVEVLEKKRTVVGEGILFSVKIKATVSTEKADDLVERLRDREFRADLASQSKEMKAKYERLDREIEALKNHLRQAGSDAEKSKIAAEITQSEQQYAMFIKSLSFDLIGQTLGFTHQKGRNEVFYEWSSDSQSQGGILRTCYVKLQALTPDLRLTTMTWNWYTERVGPETFANISLLKVTVHQMNHENLLADLKPIKVYNAWISTSSGTTVGKLKMAPPDAELYFTGAARADLFLELLPGLLSDGLTLGYQDKPGAFDHHLEISKPLGDMAAKKLYECVQRLGEDSDLRSGGGPAKKY